MRNSLLVALLVAGCGGSDGPLDVQAGDIKVHALADGSFDLTQGDRVLLHAPASSLTALAYDPQVSLLWGMFSYDPGPVTRAPLARRTALATDGGDILLSLAGDAGATGSLRFHRAEHEVTITASAAAPSLTVHSLGLRFGCDERSHFLGFGEQYQNIDHRGEAFPLWTSEQGIGRDPAKATPLSGNPWTTYFPVPFFIDPAHGYGLAVDSTTHIDVDLCKTDPAVWSLTVDEPEAVTLHLYTGPTPAEVLRDFTAGPQGRSVPAPRWSVDGAWIAVQGGPDRVAYVVKTAKDAGVPVAAVWAQDWLGQLPLGGWQFEIKYHWTLDDSLYPGFKTMLDGLHAQNVKFLGYFNPFITSKFGLTEWPEAMANNYAVRTSDGKIDEFLITVFTGSVVDLTNPDAVKWWQGYAKKALDLGMDGWMHDFGEWLPYDAVLHAGTPAREHNLYPTRWQRAAREILDGEKVTFARSGGLGSAGVSQVIWAGDQQADFDPWDGLPTVVPAMISLGLAGISWVTHDIAGFTGGPSTKELYMRWMELGAFTPIFRTHEGLTSGLNWFWYTDAETLAAFSRWARVHKLLADTFWKLDEEHAASGLPLVRALALTWPDDTVAITTSDEYTIGTDLLVAPVLTQGATTRTVYFPKGHWVDVWDPAISYDGPVSKTVNAPIGRPPVFSQSGRTDLKDIK